MLSSFLVTAMIATGPFSFLEVGTLCRNFDSTKIEALKVVASHRKELLADLCDSKYFSFIEILKSQVIDIDGVKHATERVQLQSEGTLCMYQVSPDQKSVLESRCYANY